MGGAGAEKGGDVGAAKAGGRGRGGAMKAKGKGAGAKTAAMKAMKAMNVMKAMKTKGPEEAEVPGGAIVPFKKGQRGVSHRALVKRTNSPHPPAEKPKLLTNISIYI